MSRALLVSPVARDLVAEFPGHDIARIPNATNGVKQGWDTLDQTYFTALADPQIDVYPTLGSIPVPLLKYLVQFLTADNPSANPPFTWKRWVDCTAADYIRVTNGGVNSIKAVTDLVAGDHPRDFDLMHHWEGNVQETLGAA